MSFPGPRSEKGLRLCCVFVTQCLRAHVFNGDGSSSLSGTLFGSDAVLEDR